MHELKEMLSYSKTATTLALMSLLVVETTYIYLLFNAVSVSVIWTTLISALGLPVIMYFIMRHEWRRSGRGRG